MVIGTSVLSGGASSGDVVTGLKHIQRFSVDVRGGTQKGHSVDETFPTKDIDPTVFVETADGTFDWTAIGY